MSKTDKIKKRLRVAFPESDPDAILKAVVPLISMVFEEKTKHAEKTKQPLVKKQKKKEEEKKEKGEEEEEEEEAWKCAGKIWVIPNETCPNADDTSVKKARGKIRWSRKMHILCANCHKSYKKYKRDEKKQQEKKEEA